MSVLPPDAAAQAAVSSRISPALFKRIDDLYGCEGHWLLIREGEPERDWGGDWHQSPWRHLETCLEDRWRSYSLGFVPTYCGFSDYSRTGLVGKANYNVFTDPSSTPDPFDAVLKVGYGWNGQGVCLDVRFATDEQIETIRALESYPLISDDEHSQLEMEAWEEAWRDTYASEWRDGIAKLLDAYAPAEADAFWGEETLDALPDADAKLERLFLACQEQVQEWPIVEDLSCGAYVDLQRILEEVDVSDLRDLTGLPLA